MVRLPKRLREVERKREGERERKKDDLVGLIIT
jgi:hypothetical protein